MSEHRGLVVFKASLKQMTRTCVGYAEENSTHDIGGVPWGVGGIEIVTSLKKKLLYY